jgi:hypothetical protein
MDWKECYLRHYGNFWGSPVDTITAKFPNEPDIQVLAYPEMGYCINLCSLGLTAFADKLGRKAEVLLSVAPSDAVEDAFNLMPKVIYYLALKTKESFRLKAGSALGCLEVLDADFVKKYNKSAIYFTEPYGAPPGFDKLYCDNEEGFLYQAFLISTQEFNYLSNQGQTQFEDLLEEKRVDLVDIKRASAI